MEEQIKVDLQKCCMTQYLHYPLKWAEPFCKVQLETGADFNKSNLGKESHLH